MAEPINNFIIQKTLQGIQQSAVNNDCRMPITLSLLHKINSSVNHIISSPRERIMYQSMYLLAFHAFGEFTKSHGRSQNVIQFHQITYLQDNTILISFQKYKHTKSCPHVITIHARAQPFCPVHAVKEYVKYRGSNPGPLFIHNDGRPIIRDQFCGKLRNSMKFIGLNPAFYKSHSFRIGAASHAARNGMSDSQIRHLGRWSSNAFKLYIRM